MKKPTQNTEPKQDQSDNSAPSIVRLANFIIDSLAWLTLYFLLAYLLDHYLVRFHSYTVNYIYSILLGIIVYIAYYLVSEYYFYRTLGKLITRTKVITKEGGRITFKIILKRSLARFIPIDVFYYLFSKNGLHDKLTKTLVIKSNANKSSSKI